MERSRAIELVAALRDGIDPLTGASLDATSPLRHPQASRAMQVALRDMRAAREALRLPPPDAVPPNHGKPWDSADDHLLEAGWDDGAGIAELAARIGRTRGVTRRRLVELGRLPLEPLEP